VQPKNIFFFGYFIVLFVSGKKQANITSPDLSDTLHGAADIGGDVVEAVEVPARDLGDHVVQAGLEAGGRDLSGGILQLRQRKPQGQLGGDEG
jgi:hypothetical protein